VAQHEVGDMTGIKAPRADVPPYSLSPALNIDIKGRMGWRHECGFICLEIGILFFIFCLPLTDSQGVASYHGIQFCRVWLVSESVMEAAALLPDQITGLNLSPSAEKVGGSVETSDGVLGLLNREQSEQGDWSSLNREWFEFEVWSDLNRKRLECVKGMASCHCSLNDACYVRQQTCEGE
jgi:hypothetical protein